MSCLEIYQEKMYDLFSDVNSREPLVLKEDENEGYSVDKQKLVKVTSITSASQSFDFAMSNRQEGSQEDSLRLVNYPVRLTNTLIIT